MKQGDVTDARQRRQGSFGIIGLGIGTSRCEMMQEVPEARLVAVSDLVEEKARSIAEKYGSSWYTDYHKMLERDDVDVVGVYTRAAFISTSPSTPCAPESTCSTTKPMEITLDRVDKIVDACAKAGVSSARSSFSDTRRATTLSIGRSTTASSARWFSASSSQVLPRPGLLRVQWRVARHLEGGRRRRHNEPDYPLCRPDALAHGRRRYRDRAMGHLHPHDRDRGYGRRGHHLQERRPGRSRRHYYLPQHRPFRLYGGGVTQRVEVNGEFGSATSIDGKIAMWKVAREEVVASEVNPPPSTSSRTTLVGSWTTPTRRRRWQAPRNRGRRWSWCWPSTSPLEQARPCLYRCPNPGLTRD